MDLANSKVYQSPAEMQSSVGNWKFGGVWEVGKVVLKREMSLKYRLLPNFSQGWPCAYGLY